MVAISPQMQKVSQNLLEGKEEQRDPFPMRIPDRKTVCDFLIWPSVRKSLNSSSHLMASMEDVSTLPLLQILHSQNGRI